MRRSWTSLPEDYLQIEVDLKGLVHIDLFRHRIEAAGENFGRVRGESEEEKKTEDGGQRTEDGGRLPMTLWLLASGF